MIRGYTEGGAVLTVFQKPPPPNAQIEGLFAKALADQGYLPATRQNRPSLILIFWWGYVAPIFKQEGRTATVNSGPLINADEMMEVVNGDYLPSPFKPEVMDSMEVPRWYMRVVAMDFADWQYRHKRTTLWQAHVSAGLWGYYLDEVLPTLIANGVPSFGRATEAQFAETPVVPLGRVVVGTPVLKSYVNPAPAPAAK